MLPAGLESEPTAARHLQTRVLGTSVSIIVKLISETDRERKRERQEKEKRERLC
jgi:hypothetical protein